MPWVRFEDGFAEHPKMLAVGPLGMALQVAAVCYANRALTDGFLPRAKVATLLDLEGLADWHTLAKDLVEAGVWDEADGGWRIHDYLDYQPARDDVVGAREATQQRRSEAARHAARVRWDAVAEARTDADGDAPVMQAHAPRTAHAMPTQCVDDAPTPVPNPKDQPLHPSGAAPARAKPRRRLPEDWKPTPAHERLATELGVDHAAQATAFRDYWRSEGRPKADWDAAFRTWLRKSAEDRRPRAGPRSRDPGYDPGDLRASADILRAQGR